MQKNEDICNATRADTGKTAKQLSETKGERHTQCPSVKASFNDFFFLAPRVFTEVTLLVAVAPKTTGVKIFSYLEEFKQRLLLSQE